MNQKLRLALVLPPFVLSKFRDTGMKQSLPNIGVAYLAANLDKDRIEVRIYDCMAAGMRLEGLLSKLAEFRPNVVGFNAPTYKIMDAHEAARAVKKLLPNVVTIIGGDHATAVPVETIREFPEFDIAVYGEGEKTLNELLDRFIKEKFQNNLSDIHGICYRENGRVCRTMPRAYIEDLDSLAFPAFNLMPVEKYKGTFTLFTLNHRTLTLSTGRGCMHRCVFCNRTIGGKYRSRKIASVMDEVQRNIHDFHTREFYITDESLLSNRDHIREFCEEYLKKDFQKTTTWICFSRVDEVDTELLRLMKRAGCRIVSYGIESGNEEVLKIIKKGISLKEAADAVRWTMEAGIIANTNFMIGLPGDTHGTIRDTINFALKTNAQMAAFQMMVPFPGSEAMLMAQQGQGGLRILSYDYGKFCKGVGNAHELETVPRAELERLQRNAWIRYYLRPSRFCYLFLFIDIKMLLVSFHHLLVAKLRKLMRINPNVAKETAAHFPGDSSINYCITKHNR